MLETVIIALLFCKIKGYKIAPLFKNYAIYIPLFIEVLYIIIQINIFKGNYAVIQYAKTLKIVYILSYLPLVYKYRQYGSAIIGSISMLIGGLLNDIAIKANGGFMPVFPKLSYLTGYASLDSFSKVNDIHILGDGNVKLKFLTDIFDLGYSVLSIGDIFIRFYVFIIIYSSIKSINHT
ncbi:MAG: DUF5317 family protein [Clostridium sp.]|uniref:DUF5317 family protein n=1 Tax=Clostridium sp. TaxID=1506 RepID=UPI003F34F52A